MADKSITTGKPTGSLAQRIKNFTAGLPSVSGQTGVSGIRKNIASAETGLNAFFAFDTTGSMYPFFDRVKNSISRIVNEVGVKSKRTKFGLVAYKNHGDARFFKGDQEFLATDLTDNVAFLKEAMDMVEEGGGGDGLTCLEDVFRHLNQEVKWDGQAIKILVLIGDMPPHGVLDSKSKCPFGYDWEAELQELKRKGVAVYSVFCREEDVFSNRSKKVQKFFEDVAATTNGKFLKLEEIDDVVDLLTGICLKQTGQLDDFIHALRTKNLLTESKRKILIQLKGGESDA